jgi:SAM-dependent methyltransferase
MAGRPLRSTFYLEIVQDLLASGILTRDDSVLVVCGGTADKEIFQELGFQNVTISNLDERMQEDEFRPYRWSFQDAEALGYPDDSFDLVIVSAGLHHCYSPHRALLEIYRVARKCAVALEARDSLLSRLAVRLGVVDEYEVTAVAGNALRFGGLRNSAIPNYIYRWKEREVEKTIASFAPYTPPEIRFYHRFEPPFNILRARRSLKGLLIMSIAHPILWILTRLWKSQCNLFAFAVRKPDLDRTLFPWLKLEQGKPALRADWVRARYTITE